MKDDQIVARELQFDGREMVLEEVVLRPPGPGEVRIRSEFSNVSIGTELATIRRARGQGERARGLGYSLVGVIEEAGPEAAYGPGQRVLAQAPHATAVVTDGSLDWLTPVPTELNPARATLGTLGSVALHIVERARVTLGESAVVFGQGLVGSLVTQLVRRAGAGTVIVAEPEAAKRELAEELGADRAVVPNSAAISEALAELGFDKGADLSIEVAGHPSVFPAAFEVLRVGGRLVGTSTFHEGLSVNLYPVLVTKEITVIGAHQPKCPLQRVPYYPFSQVENRRLALSMMVDGSLRVDDLITHCIGWREAPAFYGQLEGNRDALGLIIDWRGAAEKASES
jgi:2-desacetyl-2-hydroxyethyl bacteriochlorophyllide A dehydrogenase